MNFEDKVILVTGASTGIGADAARHLAKMGGKIALVGRSEKRLNVVIEKIIDDGSPTPLAIVADVTSDGERIINETIDHFGQLDVLVNNASFIESGAFVDSDISIFDEIMNTNVRSIVILTQLAVPHLEATKGNIVNVSSYCGLIAHVGAIFYCMSKAALDQLTNCMAVELGPRGIRVNSINPSLIKTPISERSEVAKEVINAMENHFGDAYPIGRKLQNAF